MRRRSKRLRLLAKSCLAGGIYYTGLLAASKLARRLLATPRVHVLGYHRVVPDYAAAARSAIPALLIEAGTLEAQLRYVMRHMDVLDLAGALEVLAGRRRLTRDACVITFDDGYQDTFTQALPILRRLGLSAALFVPSGYLDQQELLPHDRLYATLRAAAARPPAPALPWAERFADLARRCGPELAVELGARTLRHARLRELIDQLAERYGKGEPPDPDGVPMSWDMCAELSQAGWEIGSHTVSHTALGHESPAAIRRELFESRAQIEARLHRPVRFCAYPNGVYSDAVIDVCQQLGFAAGLTTEARPNRIGTHPLRIGRKLLWEAHGRGLWGRPSPALVASHLENAYADLGLTAHIDPSVEGGTDTGE
jgi:peptidoglycan/xylan/chitin deacetylase (PgdA/CDA1 family)